MKTLAIILGGLLLLSVVGNLFLAYALVDTSVSLSYARDGQRHLEEAAKLSLQAVNAKWAGRPQSEAEAFGESLRRANPDAVIKWEEKDVLGIESLQFRIANGRVQRVEYLNPIE